MNVRCENSSTCDEPTYERQSLRRDETAAYCLTCGLWAGARKRPPELCDNGYDDRRRMLGDVTPRVRMARS